jgi:hypothetical protein
MSNTLIYSGLGKDNGSKVHVLGYENTVRSLSGGPNCMLLHFPTQRMLTPDNLIKVEVHQRGILKDISDTFTPHTRGSITKGLNMRSMDKGGDNEFIMFCHDIYTIITCRNVDAIMEAIKLLPDDLTPSINPTLLAFYKKNFPNWSFALCCFNNRDLKKSSPLFWKYEPIDYNVLFAPTLDSHTGREPDLSKLTEMDHAITFGFSDKNELAENHYYKLIESEMIESYRFKMFETKTYPNFSGILPEIGITRLYKESRFINGDTFFHWKDSTKVERGMLRI